MECHTLKPFVLPASTSLALVAGAVASVLVWILKQWGSIEVPDYIRDAIIVILTAAGGHFTVDSPSPIVAKEAVADAAADADMDAAEDRAATKKRNKR